MLYVPLVGLPSLAISIQFLIAKRIILTSSRGASKVRIAYKSAFTKYTKCKSSLERPSLPKCGYSSQYTVVPPHDLKSFPFFFKRRNHHPNHPHSSPPPQPTTSVCPTLSVSRLQPQAPVTMFTLRNIRRSRSPAQNWTSKWKHCIYLYLRSILVYICVHICDVCTSLSLSLSLPLFYIFPFYWLNQWGSWFHGELVHSHKTG